MKKIILKLIILCVSMITLPSFATQLPLEVKNYVLDNVPNTSIRFDGLVTLPDGTHYLPLIPAYEPKNVEFKIKATYPENKNFNDKPDIIIFENNYCLLKLIKNKDKQLTVTQMKDFPLEIRTGLLPQDLLVPKGLVLPDSLIGVLGDLHIPLTSNLQMTPQQKIPENPNAEVLPTISQKIETIEELNNSQFFITNFSSNLIYVMPSNMTDVQYTLKLDSIPQAVLAINNDYLLVLTSGKTYIDVVDIKNEEIAKQIDIGAVPNEIVLTKNRKYAYVSSSEQSAFYVIDIPSMSLIKQISVKGCPEKIALSDDEKKLVYQDSNTSDVYSVELNNDYVNIYQCTEPNVSKLSLIGDNVYALSRTKNVLKIYPYQELARTENSIEDEILGTKKDIHLKNALWVTGTTARNKMKQQKEQEEMNISKDAGISINTNIKPIDMIYQNNKLYILSSAENVLNVFNPKNQKIEKTIKLGVDGFSNKINKIAGSDIVIITNVLEKKYAIVDLKENKVLQINPIDIPVSTLTVIEQAEEL